MNCEFCKAGDTPFLISRGMVHKSTSGNRYIICRRLQPQGELNQKERRELYYSVVGRRTQ